LEWKETSGLRVSGEVLDLYKNDEGSKADIHEDREIFPATNNHVIARG
jgi:hypothetical protein